VSELSALITQAMKAHDAPRLSALRMLKAALMNKEVEKGRALDEVEGLQVVSMLVKQRRESIEQFTKGGRTDLADKETAELGILQEFLPPPVDEAALQATIRAVVAETGAASAKDFGRVMKALMPRLSGQSVDGKLVRDLVQQQLAGPSADS
jgi:uncharacterized protein